MQASVCVAVPADVPGKTSRLRYAAATWTMHRLHRVSFVSIVPLQGLLEARHSDIHRESCLYLPCRFSQLSTEIPGDVLFPQDGPPKITQLSKQIEKFHRFAEEDSCSINVKVIKHGLRFDGFRRRFASCSPFTVGIEGAGPFF